MFFVSHHHGLKSSPSSGFGFFVRFCFCQSIRSNVCGLVMLSSDNNTSNNIVLRVYEQVFMRYMDERTERHFCVVVGSVAVFCISAQKWIDI